jgi:hypothetical protein
MTGLEIRPQRLTPLSNCISLDTVTLERLHVRQLTLFELINQTN